MEFFKELVTFEQTKAQLEGANSSQTSANNIEDSIKYAGKTETQINYLKHMEELEKNQK